MVTETEEMAATLRSWLHYYGETFVEEFEAAEQLPAELLA